MLSGNQKNTDSLCNFIMYRASIELLQFHCNISISFPYLLWRIFLSDKLECSYNINKGTIDSKILQGLNSMNFFHCASDCTFRRDNIATALIFTWAQAACLCVGTNAQKQTKGKYSPSEPSAQQEVNDHTQPGVNRCIHWIPLACFAEGVTVQLTIYLSPSTRKKVHKMLLFPSFRGIASS